MWDLKTGACLRTMRGHKAEVEAMVVTDRIFSGSLDGAVCVWPLDSESDTVAPLCTLSGHSEAVVQLLSTGGADGVDDKEYDLAAKLARRRVVSCSLDGTVRIWRLLGDAAKLPAVAAVDKKKKRVQWALK